MLRLLLGAMLFVCCGYVGYAVGAHYRKRYNLFVGVNGYIDALQNGISYLQSTLGELTSSYISDRKDDFSVMLKKYCELLDKGAISKDDCRSIARTRLLTGYEQSVLTEMLFSLGKSDIDTQLAELAKYKNLLAPITESAKLNQKKYGTLAFKLGILAGLAALLAAA